MGFGQPQSHKKSSPCLRIEPERHYICLNEKQLMNEKAHERVGDVTSSSLACDLRK